MFVKMFKNKNILITGGSRGIGFSLAMEFASHGANIALIARDKESLTQARSEIETYGVRCLAYACDVTDPTTLCDYVNMVRYELQGLDGVVANAGYCHPGRFHELTLEDFRRQIDTNLNGVIYTAHAALPHLLEAEDPFLAIVSSPAGNAGIYGFSAYGPTKAALNNLAHVLRHEYASEGLNVHLLLPPDTATPGYENEKALYPPVTREILRGGRLHEADKVARTLLEGIITRQPVVTVGFESRLLLWTLRYMPWIWERYVRKRIRHIAKQEALATSAGEAEESEPGSENADSEQTKRESAA